MAGIYFDDAKLKNYSAALSKGGKSIIKIEIETTDRFELAYILRQCDEIDAEQKAPKTPAPVGRKATAPLALPAPPLALTYSPEEK